MLSCVPLHNSFSSIITKGPSYKVIAIIGSRATAHYYKINYSDKVECIARYFVE